eukprot:scaffold16712_cov65-Phaeocystis_antarctica.AAC.15
MQGVAAWVHATCGDRAASKTRADDGRGVRGHLDRLERVVDDARCADPGLLHRLHQPGVRLVALRAGAHEVEGDDARQLEPRVDNVVTVADVDDALTLDGAQHLLHRQSVRDDLAGVVEVRQSVDHRYRRVLGEAEDVLVREEPRHDDVVHAGEDARDVCDRLALADPNLLAQAQRVPAQSVEARLEGDARAGGRLGEHHGERARVEGPVRRRALEHQWLDLLGEIEQRAHLLAREVIDRQKVVLAVGKRRRGLHPQRRRARGDGQRRSTSEVVSRAQGEQRGQHGDRTATWLVSGVLATCCSMRG